MNQTNKPTMRPFSVRIYDDTRELYEELRGERTHDNFISTLLEGYQNPRKIEVPQEVDKKQIKELTEKLNTLQEHSNDYLSQIEELHQNIDVLEKDKNLLAQKLNENKNKVFFDIDERIEKILKEVQKRIKEKQNLDITDKNVLFYVGVRDGYLKL